MAFQFVWTVKALLVAGVQTSTEN